MANAKRIGWAVSTVLATVLLLTTPVGVVCAGDEPVIAEARASALARFQGPPAFAASDVRDAPALASRVLAKRDPVSGYLCDSLDKTRFGQLRDAIRQSSRTMAMVLAGCLNGVLLDRDLYDPARFRQIALGDRAQRLVRPNVTGLQLVEMNYQLLCAAYPNELSAATPVPLYRGRRNTGWRDLDSYTVGQALLEVDVSTGAVTSARYPAVVVGSSSCISVTEAQATATRWLRDRGIDIDGFHLVECRKLDHGISQEVCCRWEKRSPDGVRLPSFVVLSLNPMGLVQAFYFVDRPISVDLKPTLSAADATRVACAVHDGRVQPVGSCGLRVWYGADEQQRLLWVVTIAVGDGVVACDVDAHSGEIVGKVATGGGSASPSNLPGVGADVADGRSTQVADALVSDLGAITTVRLVARRRSLFPGQGLSDPLGPEATTIGALQRGQVGFAAVIDAVSHGLAAPSIPPGVEMPCWLLLENPDRQLAYLLRFDPRTGGAILDRRVQATPDELGSQPARGVLRGVPISFRIRLPGQHQLYAELTPEAKHAIGLPVPIGRTATRPWMGLLLSLGLAVAAAFATRRFRPSPNATLP